MSSFSDVPALHVGGDLASDAARLQADLQDLQRERRQVICMSCGIGAHQDDCIPPRRPSKISRASHARRLMISAFVRVVWSA